MKSKNHKPRKPRNRRPTRGKASHDPKRSGTRQSRAKPKAPMGIFNPANPTDRALARVKLGASQKAAAKAEGISVKSLRKFMKKNTRSKWVNGKWKIKDARAIPMLIRENGKFQFIPVGSKGATKIGNYWNAVNRFLDTNDPKQLPSIRNASVRDAYGKLHHLELDPNVLRRSDSIGELSFHTLYPKTVI